MKITVRLNAPFGARCFLTWTVITPKAAQTGSLNAPFGARCFLTWLRACVCVGVAVCLNAPFGARCFLTPRAQTSTPTRRSVLMHLLALGAF